MDSLTCSMSIRAWAPALLCPIPVFYYQYMYFLHTSHASIVGKKMLLLDCCKLEKYLNKYVLLFAVYRRIWVHQRVLQTFVDLYGPHSSPKYCIPLKVDQTSLGRGLKEPLPQKCFTYCCILVAFIRYQNAPMQKRNLQNFFERGSINPPRVYCNIFSTQKWINQPVAHQKMLSTPQQIFLVAPLCSCPSIWNSLPVSLHDLNLSLEIFRWKLKLHLFIL